MRQDDQKFQATLGYIEFESYMRPCLENPKEKKERRVGVELQWWLLCAYLENT